MNDQMDGMKILAEGYVQLVESWGSDQAIIEAARMSTNKGFEGWGDDDEPGDERLLGYLYRNKHATPFEMAGVIVEVKAPLFVFREWHRHRTQSYNEMSARYVPMPNENYVPTIERIVEGAKTTGNKQAAGTAQLDQAAAEQWLERLEKFYADAEQVYADGLACGVPKELARLAVPVARYSRMRASANLRNWLAFLTLRQSPKAQWEIRQYADAVGRIIASKFPRTWELYQEGSDTKTHQTSEKS